MNPTQTADTGEARDMLRSAVEDMLRLADEYQTLARSTPDHLPYIAQTAKHIEGEARLAARTLGQMFRAVSLGNLDRDVADAYIDAARIQHEHLADARRLLARVIA